MLQEVWLHPCLLLTPLHKWRQPKMSPDVAECPLGGQATRGGIFLGETGGRKPVSHPSGCKLSDSGQDPPRCRPEFPHPKGEVSGGSGWSLRTRLSGSPRLNREVWSAAPAACCGFTTRCKDTHLPGLPFPPAAAAGSPRSSPPPPPPAAGV